MLTGETLNRNSTFNYLFIYLFIIHLKTFLSIILSFVFFSDYCEPFVCVNMVSDISSYTAFKKMYLFFYGFLSISALFRSSLGFSMRVMQRLWESLFETG